MEKVITVEPAYREVNETFKEFLYPELNRLLEDGWKVKQVIPHDSTARAIMTFILFKNI